MYVRAMLALQQHDEQQAICLLTQCCNAARETAQEVTYRLALAEALYLDGHPYEAVREWQRVLQLDAEQPTALAWLELVDCE